MHCIYVVYWNRWLENQEMPQEKEDISVTSLVVYIAGSIQRSFINLIRIFLQYTKELINDSLNMGIFSTKCLSTTRLDGKTAIITGSNTGIGKYTAKEFFRRGARVIMACRNLDAANKALREIENECKQFKNCGELLIAELDLASLESVRKCAQHLLKTENRINLLVNNAAIMMCPHWLTKDGYEIQFGTNHLGHFLFTLLLLPKIVDSKPARILNVSSVAHIGGYIDFDDINWEKRPYSPFKAYEQSKLANVLFSAELARRLKKANIDGVNTYSLHPGVIATDLGRNLNALTPGLKFLWNVVCKRFIKTPEQGIQTTLHCSVDEQCAHQTGLYYTECKVKPMSKEAEKEDVASKLWDISIDLVKLKKDYDPFKKI